MRLLTRIFGGYVLLLAVVLAVGAWVTGRQAEHQALDAIRSELASGNRVLAALVGEHLLRGSDPTTLQATVYRPRAQDQMRLTVIAADGTVLADSLHRPGTMENHADRPEIIQALATGSGTSRRFSATSGYDTIYHARAIGPTDQPTVVRTALPNRVMARRSHEIRLAALLSFLVALLPALLLGLLVARSITRPLTRISLAARALARGERVDPLPARRRDEVGELARAFNEMSRELDARLATITAERNDLERLEGMRRHFVADISHELKTPLTGLLCLVHTVLDDPDMPADRRADFLRRAIRQGELLNSLTVDLLHLSRLEAGEDLHESSHFRLDELCREVADDLDGRCRAGDLTLTCELPSAPLTVYGDAECLRQAIENLLTNAIVYTPPGGRVGLRLYRNAGSAVVAVTDTGPGIPAEDQERIFHRFVRLDKARSRASGGTGLGLAIVKHVARRHAGSVEVESDGEHGSTFRLSLPLGPETAGPRDPDRS